MTLLELLTRIDGAKSQKERGELLKQNQNHHLENLLWYTFHPDVKFIRTTVEHFGLKGLHAHYTNFSEQQYMEAVASL